MRANSHLGAFGEKKNQVANYQLMFLDRNLIPMLYNVALLKWLAINN